MAHKKGTIIIGIQQDKHIWLGADDMSIAGNRKWYGENKFFERKDAGNGKLDWLAVVAGGVRSSQIFSRASVDFTIENETDIYGLSDIILNAHHSVGFGKAENNELPEMDMECLIASRPGLYYISSDLTISKEESFATAGIGYEYAASIVKLQLGKYKPKRIIETAIDITGQLSPYCSSRAIIKKFKL